MKVLFIPGENDYDALTFETYYKGAYVGDIIRAAKKDRHLIVADDDGTEFEMSHRIIEVPDIVISKEFRNFIKNDVLDYDSGKHCNFYLETDYIK